MIFARAVGLRITRAINDAVCAERVFTVANNKYNMAWQEGMPFSWCVAKAINHLTLFLTEGDTDSDGIPHLEQVEWYCQAIRDFPDQDDRPNKAECPR